MFSRYFRRPKGAKTKICFTFGAFVVLLSSSFVVAVVVSTGADLPALCCYFADVSKIALMLSILVRSLPFSGLSRFARLGWLQICPYFAF